MNEQFSKIRLGMVQGNKHYLKDVDSPQMQWVKIEVSHPENGRVFEVEMSMTQFSQMLATNSQVSCTIKSMYGKDGKIIEENVSPPKSVEETLSENLKTNKENISKRFADLTEDLNHMIESKSVSKKKLKEALDDLKIISSHHASNSEFYLKEAKAKVEEINNDKKAQIINLIDQGYSVKKLSQNLELDTPLIEEYENKDNVELDIEKMNKREIAREIDIILKSFKEDTERLFEPNAQEVKNGLRITYTSYQGSSFLSLENSRSYLKELKNMKEFKTHFSVLKK